MNNSPKLTVTPWNESSGTCDCCGRTSKTIWGDISSDEDTLAIYYIQWTIGAPEHNPNIDLIVGAWGEGAKPEQRTLISMLYRPSSDGGSFMVIDAEDRYAFKRELCARGMRRVEVVGTPLAQEVFALVDAIWLSEPRINEVKALNNVA